MFGKWLEKSFLLKVQIKDVGENHENLKNAVRLDGLLFMDTWLVVNIVEIDKFYDEFEDEVKEDEGDVTATVVEEENKEALDEEFSVS